MSSLNAAQAMLTRLGQLGIKYLFSNSGTDFAPIIEAYEAADDAQLSYYPKPLTIPHETVAVAMAHGAYLVSGAPQAIMVHVNVGLANALMGLINAQSDQIPLLMLAGRTPLTEYGREGSRMTPIQYGQEMRDQAQMVRQVVKWDYELRYGEQIVDAIDRAWLIAQSVPKGPVFLGLPREPLAESIDGGRTPDHPMPSEPVSAAVQAYEIGDLIERLQKAKAPLIICQRNDVTGNLGRAVARLCEAQGIAVVEPFVISNLMASEASYHLGYQLGNLLADSDLVLVIESPVPWIQRFTAPRTDAFVAHIARDPSFANLPMRSFVASVNIAADPAQVVDLLIEAVKVPDVLVSQRRARLATLKARQKAFKSEAVAQFNEADRITPALVSAVLSEVIDESTLIFSELGPPPGFAGIKFGNQWFTPPYSGGLGWGLPAAMGAKLARPCANVIACVGDGSYIFANPVACYQVMAALEVPLLTVVMDNASWNATRRAVHNMYPQGAAAKNSSPVLTSLAPSPDFAAIAAASGGSAVVVDKPSELKHALVCAYQRVTESDESVTLIVNVEKTDGF